jgi:hypothetical protein
MPPLTSANPETSDMTHFYSNQISYDKTWSSLWNEIYQKCAGQEKSLVTCIWRLAATNKPGLSNQINIPPPRPISINGCLSYLNDVCDQLLRYFTLYNQCWQWYQNSRYFKFALSSPLLIGLTH